MHLSIRINNGIQLDFAIRILLIPFFDHFLIKLFVQAVKRPKRQLRFSRLRKQSVLVNSRAVNKKSIISTKHTAVVFSCHYPFHFRPCGY